MEKALREIIDAVAAGLDPQSDAAMPNDEWLAKLVRRRNREMHDGTRRVAKRRLLPYYLKMRVDEPDVLEAWGVTSDVDEAMVKLLRAKPRRTASGVATVTVLTKPRACSSDCVYCPNDVRMPKSYLANEPACQRAERNFFDPYLQVTARLRVLADMGHVTDKVELIVLGGTWSDYSREYRTWFMKELFRALNDFGTEASTIEYAKREQEYAECGIAREPDELASATASAQKQVDLGELSYNAAIEQLYGSTSAWARCAKQQTATFEELEKQHDANVTSAHRCVGLVIETRPDLIDEKSLIEMRRLGCTKIQMGVQTLDENILRANGRNVSLSQIERAFELLRLFGFKSHIHIMANLPGATPDFDRNDYKQLVTDKRFLPDEIKLYPCVLVESAKLYRDRSDWQPYYEEELVELLADDVLATPEWTRISRMIRDISATDIVVGNKKTNLRQMVENEVRARGATDIAEMRMREIATDGVSPDGLQLKTESYETTVSSERFLQWVTPEGRLAGFCRLSLPHKDALQKMNEATSEPGVPKPGEAMIREVHVYGKVAALGNEGEAAQHTGLGRKLVEEACRQAREAGYKRINVISAVGTREYYKNLGFNDGTLYMQKRL